MSKTNKPTTRKRGRPKGKHHKLTREQVGQNFTTIANAIDGLIPPTEQFAILAKLARRNTNRGFEALKLLLSYRYGKPAIITVSKDATDPQLQEFMKMAGNIIDPAFEASKVDPDGTDRTVQEKQ